MIFFDIPFTADVLRYYAGWPTKITGDTIPIAIESGQVWVNCYQAADSALPFGGTKKSGWGRETCRETLEEYLEAKTVVVSL